MPDLDLYQGAYTGPQIDAAIAKVQGADATPTAGSTNLVISGGVKAAITENNTLEWRNLSPLESGNTGQIRYAKDAHGVKFLDVATTAGTETADQTLGTLPDGYRPSTAVYGLGYNSNHGYLLRVSISKAGVIKAKAFINAENNNILPVSAKFTSCSFQISYI